MTVPEKPLPASKPLPPVSAPEIPRQQPASGHLDKRLLPMQASAPTDPFTLKLTNESEGNPQTRAARDQVVKADTVLSGRTVAEDMVLRGTVLIKGSLVVAPQATLRIDPGTIVRFAPAIGSEELPRLVIQGRIVASGTGLQPIVIGSVYREPAAGDWGGVVLLNSEKKNSLDHCRIEGSQAGIEAHFSRFTGRGLSITHARAGIILFDSEASLQGSTINRCDTGCKLSDSELDLRDSTIRENRLGIVARRSSFTLNSVNIAYNSQDGILTDQCRFKFSGSQFSHNRCGIKLTGGDGQIFLCRFFKNRENGAELAQVRIRINNSSFSQNTGFGMVLDNARGTIAGSAFSDNRAGNLQNRGGELFAALLNWWGASDEKIIAAGIVDQDGRGATLLVPFVPFLKERPATAP